MRTDFVVVPFAPITHPALGVSNLAAVVKAQGHECTIHYESLHFAATTGLPLYLWFSQDNNSDLLLLGDFLFSLLRQPPESRPALVDSYLQEVIGSYVSSAPEVQRQYEVFFQEWLAPLEAASQAAVRRLLANDPDILGFSIGPAQAGAALTLAYLAKQARPEVAIWLGGQSCMGSIGNAYLKSFPWVDAVFTGYAEKTLLSVLPRLRRGQSLLGIPGVLTREVLAAGRIRLPGDDIPELADLDQLPLPDFTDYFSCLESQPFSQDFKPILVMETSRGCWWGAKHPCHFCGLNIHTQGYHAKSAGRLLAELREISSQFGINSIEMADNILSPHYFDTLFPNLAANPGELHLFFEIRSDLSRTQVALLKRAGVEEVQVGVEALDDQLLRLLRKGTTAFHNLQLLKWLEEENILVRYNHLFAIPGETKDCYDRLLALMPFLHHLPPPNLAHVRLDRYSTYADHPERFGIDILGPYSVAHHCCFPEPCVDHLGLSYHFSHAFLEPHEENKTWWDEVRNEVRRWQWDYYRLHKRLFGRRLEGQVFIEDNRFTEKLQTYALTEVQAAVLETLDSFAGTEAVIQKVGNQGFPERAARRALMELEDLRLIVRHRRQALGLVVFTTSWPYNFNARLRNSFVVPNITPNSSPCYSASTRWLLQYSRGCLTENFLARLPETLFRPGSDKPPRQGVRV